MSTPTKEQQTAIDTRGKNIIVSAGAGSGKTFVLKERVLKEVSTETTVDKLIILTFTKNAAAEMKGRIRKIISEHEEVKDQAFLVDSAYITTFDSFANSLVKKYNYLLGMDKNFGLIDTNIVNTELNHILDNIFLDYYKSKDEEFVKMINDYCYKNDDALKENIIKIYRDSSRIIERKEFFDNYIDKYYSKKYVDEMIDKYVNMIFDKREGLTSLYDDLLNVSISDKCIEENTIHINAVMEASSYEELQEAFNTHVSRYAKGKYDDNYKPIKDKIAAIENDIVSSLKYDLKTLKEQYMSTKTSAKVIIDIVMKLNEEITKFKKEHNSYEFIDISLKAIELVRDHEDVRNEIKNSTYEIMIDEYQDTDDIQETFIGYIQNNNVYMVGDVKQSIYRFRNANPYIFKGKYDEYSPVGAKDAKGYRIDLTANFRSRGEVIQNINDLFNVIMTDKVGGADYKKMHNMAHGNKTYDEHIMDDYDYNMEILSYNNEDKEYSDNEVEAFIMAEDILKRINNKEQVMEENGTLRDATYKDFCVLIDKSKNFDLIKKIFEYKGIPSTIYKDISIKDDDEIYILKNLVTLLIKIKNNCLDIDFKHAYMSIGRSYIYKMKDQELFDIFTNNTFEETPLFNKIKELSNRCDSLSNKEILTMLIDEFDIMNKLITVGDIDERSTKLEYFITTGDSLNKFGMDIYSMNDYFEETLKSDNDITMSGKNDSGNAVKIMTIHGSKGLEFAYVYSPYLNSGFTPKKKSDEFYSSKYGLVLPYNDGMLDSTFINKMYETDEKLETVSEKLRLFYVNITRAKEKFIMINQFKEKDCLIEYTNEDDILNSTSYSNILGLLKNKLSKYIKQVNLSDLNISRDYLNIKEYNYKSALEKVPDVINTKELVIESKLLENKHFSKALTKVMDKPLKEKLDFGTYMHYVFEVYDFKNNNLDDLDITNEAKDKIKNFLKHPETSNIKNGICYKEHEIRFNKDGATFHGFIDLLVEYEDHFDIIDYKLSNVDSEEYVIQLNGYKDYIESRYKKDTNIYLYSINKDIFKKLN